MLKLFPKDADIEIYKFWDQKIVGVLAYQLRETFPTITQINQMDLICKSYTPFSLMYQLTTLMFTKL